MHRWGSKLFRYVEFPLVGAFLALTWFSLTISQTNTAPGSRLQEGREEEDAERRRGVRGATRVFRFPLCRLSDFPEWPVMNGFIK